MTMRRRAFGVGLVACVAGGLFAQSLRAAGSVHADAGERTEWEVAAGDGAQDSFGLVPAASGVVTLGDQPAAWSEGPYARAGSLVGPLLPVTPTRAVIGWWRGDRPAGAAVRLEVRGWTGGRPTAWLTLPEDSAVCRLPWTVAAVQFRLTLLALAGEPGPTVRSVGLRVADDAPLQASAPAVERPPLRIYATRIGLVGQTTANGHVIRPDDWFVALPSRRVLASRQGTEYQVKIEYRGQTATAPVWDVGPWNVRDNYWDARVDRDMWNDLPVGRPQAMAAFQEAYRGGRDGFGRKVLSPAGIDLADGLYAALGFTASDWAMVTFLWPAASP